MNDITILSSARMTSLEIAGLVEKRHDNVKRTIETIAEKCVIALPQIEDVPYVDESGRNRTTNAYIFTGEQGKRDSIVVVAQLSPEFTGKLVDRWQALESGAARPAFQLGEPTPPNPKTRKAIDSPQVQALKLTGLAMQAAKAFGFKGTSASLSADNAVRAITGVSPLVLMDATALRAEEQEALLLVSEVAARLDWKPRTTNPRMTESGLQTEYRDTSGKLCYELTATGQAFGVYVDSNRRHANGSLIRSLKWRASVVDFLRPRYPVGCA
jgi:phage regulator Rha-like protein